MTCRRLTRQEFENLPPNATGFQNQEDCDCRTITTCSGGTCTQKNKSLCDINPLNTCGYDDDPGQPCPEVDYAINTVHTDFDYVIICCDSIGGRWGFTQAALDAEDQSSKNGTGLYDCRDIMQLYSPTEEGDYCDRIALQYDPANLNCP